MCSCYWQTTEGCEEINETKHRIFAVVFPLLHLMSLYFPSFIVTCKNQTNTLRSTSQDSVDLLHVKIFTNYRQWCKHVQVSPQFASPADPNDDGNIGGKPLDILLWFFIWGEAANLRHMPESLCFLYHKMMTSFKSRFNGTLEGGARYPGHFLDNTISPIYEVYTEIIIYSNTNSK